MRKNFAMMSWHTSILMAMPVLEARAIIHLGATSAYVG
jgi:hypothetical protein